MQHPKKIVRTQRIVGQRVTHQQTTNIVRKIQRRSPQMQSSEKPQGKEKSQMSLKLSKSSEGSSFRPPSSKLQKRESFELIVPQQYILMQKQLYQLKKMQLSKDFRQKLIKLQRYDLNFLKQSQKLLKGTLEQELKRLQKQKNKQKQMRVKFYDTELLVTCLFYHQKLTADMSKLQLQLQQSKLSKVELQKKIDQVQSQHKRQLNKLNLQTSINSRKSSISQGQKAKQLPKQLQTAINFMIRGINNKQYPQAIKQINLFIQKAQKLQSYQYYIKILQKIKQLSTQIQNYEKNSKSTNNDLIQINKNIDLSNKYVRQNKWSELEKLQAKLVQAKSSKIQLNLSLLLESVIQNNRTKTKELSTSKSKEKISSSTLISSRASQNQQKQIQNLKKQIKELKIQMAEQKRKSSLVIQQKSKQTLQVNRLKSLQKKYQQTIAQMQQTISQMQKISISPQKSSLLVLQQSNHKKIQQKNKSLEQQKRSLQSKTKFLQQNKQTIQQKVSMLQKKNTSLQLSLKSKQQQFKQIQQKLNKVEKQLAQSKIKIQNLQKQQKIQKNDQSNGRITESQRQKIITLQLTNLQTDFNKLSKQKQEDQQNFIKIIEEKNMKIREYQARLQLIDKHNIGKNQQILQLELQQRQKQLIKLKKQLIQSLQANSSSYQNTPLKSDNKNKTSTNFVNKTQSVKKQIISSQLSLDPIDSLMKQINQIRKQKQQQSLSRGFSIQFNNIQREQWREVSKKIKQYKKKYPNQKFFTYLDQKHKYQFDLTEKLTDYEEKMLAIHNGVYRIKSVVTGHTTPHLSTPAKKNKIQAQSEKWWENIDSIHIQQKTEFAKLFNSLIDQLHKFYSKGNLNLVKINESKIESNSDKYNKQILQQVQVLETRFKDTTKNLSSDSQKQVSHQIYTNPQYLYRKIIHQKTNFVHLAQFLSSIGTFIKFISNFIISRQLYHTKNLSNQSSQIKKSHEALVSKQRQFNQISNKYQQLQKQKKIIEKNLDYKTKELQKKQQLNQYISTLEEQVKKYSYFKEVIQEEETIVEYYTSIKEGSSSTISQSKISSTENLSTLSKKPTSTADKSVAKTESSKIQKFNKNSSQIIDNFKRKYPSNIKIINFLQKLTIQLDEQKKKVQESKQLFELVSQTIQQFTERFQTNQISKDQITKTVNNRNTNTKKHQKLGQFNDYIKRKYYGKTQFQRAKKVVSQQQSKHQNLDQKLLQSINAFDTSINTYFKSVEQNNQQNDLLRKKISTLQLSNEQSSRQLSQLFELEKIFQYIIEKKIINAKIESLCAMTEKQATINKDPEIIRQLYDNQIKKKIRSSGVSPYDMLKKSQTPKSYSVHSNSLSNYSMKTSRIEQHSNPIIQTVFKLFAKVNELHINYEDSLIQRNEDSRIKINDTVFNLREQNERIKKQLAEVKDKFKNLERNSKTYLSNQNQYSQVKNKFEQLQQKYSALEKQKKQLQTSTKKFQILKKQFQQERILLQKIVNINLGVSQSLNSSAVIVSRQGPKQTNHSLQMDQKRQISTYKKSYPKSKLILFIQTLNRKFNNQLNKLISLQNQKQAILNFYQQLLQRIEKNTQQWYKNFQPKLKNNGDVCTVVKDLVKQICELKKQLSSHKAKTLQLQKLNANLTAQTSQLSLLQTSLESLCQVVQSLQKLIQQKFSSTSTNKQKQQIFTNQYYLKNIFQQQTRKKKLSIQSIQSISSSLSRLLQQISLQSSIRDSKKSQQFINSKKKLMKEKQDLNQRIIQINLRNKELEVLNKELSTENKLIKQSLKKLQNSINYLQDNQKSTQHSQKSKQYEILRLKQTIQTYVNQQTKLELSINKLQKQKKQQQRHVQKYKKQIQKLKQQIYDQNQQKSNLNKIIQSLRHQHGEKQNSMEESQGLINNLKINYAKTQRELHAIEIKISSLMEEKSALQQQLNKVRTEYKKQKQTLQKQLQNKKNSCQTLQKNSIKMQKDIQQLSLKLKHQQNTKQLQISHNLSIIQRLQAQIKQFNIRQKKQKDQLLKKIDFLIQQKSQFIEKSQKQVQKYRQKLFQLETQKQKSKNLQLELYSKDFSSLNKSYNDMIGSYQKQKLQARQKINKITVEYENMIKKYNQEKIDLVNKYELLISQQKQANFESIKDLKDNIQGLTMENDKIKSNLALSEQELSKVNQQKYVSNTKVTQLQSKLKQLEFKIQLNQQKLIQSQKNFMRLLPFQRKVKQYQTILLQNNISLSQYTQSSNANSNRKPSNNINSNNLQTKLRQLQTMKQKCQKLQSMKQKLSLELQKQALQKQFIKQQTQLNRQDYIKLAAQSKEQLRHLRQENKLISYEKNISQNQLSYYKETIKQLNEKISVLEEKVRNIELKADKQKTLLKDNIEREHNMQINYLQKELNQKVLRLKEFQGEMVRLKEKIQYLNHQNKQKQLQLIENGSKFKQFQIKVKLQKQKAQIFYNSQKNQLKNQIQTLKANLNKTKFQLQLSNKDLSLYKLTSQQKTKQNLQLKYELESLQKLTKVQKTNYDNKIKDLLINIDGLQFKFQEYSRTQYINKTNAQNKQNTEIKFIEREFNSKVQELDNVMKKNQQLERMIRQLRHDLDNLNSINHQTEQKLDNMMKQNSHLIKVNLDYDMKIKDMERNYKFQHLELNAQLQFYKRIYSELEGRYQSLQKQLCQGQTPFSPSTISRPTQAKQNFSIKMQQLQIQNLNLKKQLQSSRHRIQQLDLNNSKLKQKINQYSNSCKIHSQSQIQLKRMKQQMHSLRTQIQFLSNKVKQLQTIKYALNKELSSFDQQMNKKRQQNRSQLEKYKNSQRVLDHQLIEYKSKIQNIQECLRQEKQKNCLQKMEIQKLKQLSFQYSNRSHAKGDSYKLSFSLQSQLQKLRIHNHELDKKLITREFELKQYQQREYAHVKQIQALKSQVHHIRRQNQLLLHNQSSSISFINTQNIKLRQILQILQLQQRQHSLQQLQNKTQYNLLLQISSKIQNLISENKKLERKCLQSERQIILLSKSMNSEFRYEEVVVYYVQNMIEQITEFFLQKSGFESHIQTMNMDFKKIEPNNLRGYFDSVQKYIKRLIEQSLAGMKNQQAIARYEQSIQNLKNLIKIYLQEGDSSAYHSLIQICRE